MQGDFHHDARTDTYYVTLAFSGPAYEKLKEGLDCTHVKLVEGVTDSSAPAPHELIIEDSRRKNA